MRPHIAIVRGAKGVIFMKTRCPLVALCTLFAGSAIAQTLFLPALTTNVPFDFVVNHTTLPAGEYLVSANNDGHRLVIQNKADPQYAIFVANNDIVLNQSQIRDQGKMVFAVSNGQRVLHQIYLAGDNHTHDIMHASDVPELVPTR